MVYWFVPLTGELEPVAAVPPICVELAICKAFTKLSTAHEFVETLLTGELRKGSKDILEDD